ncbi:OmpA family protein [Cellulophaga baltica]|uniref:OmpA family protein n=1 Tax=Cellulophaga TaxID=104264 RepID=UPI001C068AA2|nr:MULTISPECIES: OmpA family protein [Cellulophaga]MBU2996986.1 OmpA family protein [Cellulophaga baltica]MDO6768384.1 OmpA family protein [Cellulophaga sp. 1_MG-2023]
MKIFTIVTRSFILLGFFLLAATYGNSQNLINNPSFENLDKCPNKIGAFDEITNNWLNASKGSTDSFSACSNVVPTGNNFIGNQEAYDGDVYAGIYLFAENDYREYLSTKIKKPLIKGKTYIVSFMVSRAEKTEFAVDEFDVLFTQKALDQNSSKFIDVKQLASSYEAKIVAIPEYNLYTKSDGWQEVSAVYVANGTENYMTIGNFRSNVKTRRLKIINAPRKAAYYFLDMVSLQEDEPINWDQKYVVDNLLFKQNEAIVDCENNEQLKRVLLYLKAFPEKNIFVYGHTDAVGNTYANKVLSEKRAKSVASFLIENGLNRNRVQYKGFGDSEPIANNRTREGKLKNRRVEFVVSESYTDNYASSTLEK